MRVSLAQNRSKAVHKLYADVAQLVEHSHGKGKVASSILAIGSKERLCSGYTLTNMYIQQIAQEFYDYSFYIKGYSKYTIKRYRLIINYYSKYSRIERVDEINEENVRGFFFYGRIKRHWNTNSFISYRNTMIVFLRWCVEKKYLSCNYAEDIEVPKLEKRLRPKLTKQEAMRLLEIVYNYPYHFKFLRYRNHAMFSMFVFAGLRRAELLKLRYTDVDIENLSIFINQGKGSKDRVIPMSNTLAQILNKYVGERNNLKKTCPEFFVSLTRNRGFTEDGLKHLVIEIKKVCDVKFTIHQLRHTFATLMLEGGCDIYSLSKMMGHSDIKTTTIYLAASVEHLRSQMVKHPLNGLI